MNAARDRFVLKQPSVCSGRELNGATVHARLTVHYTKLDESGIDFTVLVHIHAYCMNLLIMYRS